MPRVRIEWMPVQLYGLGRLGFDHLQLVLEQGEGTAPQDDWYVMEGVREATDIGVFLGIEGADGHTTLAIANLAARSDLTDKIGTPDHRGSRPLPIEGEELRAWETMSAYAREIEAEDYPYIAVGLPGSPTPTINSSSAIASLMHYAGVDPTATLPYGMRLSPGMSTLLGTGGNDVMRAEHGFTTLLGGRGDDLFLGSGDAQTEKFFGGEGDDIFRWSGGFNIMHGGQPQLAYSADGTDVVDYSGAGEVAITFNRHWVPHKSPNFTAVHDHGLDHLFSVERIQWNAKTDKIELGKGVDLLEDNRVMAPHAGMAPASPVHVATLVASDDAVLGDATSGSEADDRLIGTDADEVIDAKAGDDTLYGGGGNDTLIGGPGSDGYVYLAGDGDDIIVDLGGDAGFDELLLSGGIAPEDVQAYRIDDHDLLLALPTGSILVSGFFSSSGAGIERVVFDDAPAWAREDLDHRAVVLDPQMAGAAEALAAPGDGFSGTGANIPGHPFGWHPEPHLLALF
jgi:Ca2+-binding RTX toxin-like protein